MPRGYSKLARDIPKYSFNFHEKIEKSFKEDALQMNESSS
jgi:hypothetical protein